MCGLVLGICYGVRGLGALVYPVPMVFLGWEGWKGRERSAGWGGAGRFVGLGFLVGGLLLALGVYGVVWYLPHRAELTRVNHYYLFQQLIPAGLDNIRFDVTQALSGTSGDTAPISFAMRRCSS